MLLVKEGKTKSSLMTNTNQTSFKCDLNYDVNDIFPQHYMCKQDEKQNKKCKMRVCEICNLMKVDDVFDIILSSCLNN